MDRKERGGYIIVKGVELMVGVEISHLSQFNSPFFATHENTDKGILQEQTFRIILILTLLLSVSRNLCLEVSRTVL